MKQTYKPVQIPHLLNDTFEHYFVYRETFIPSLSPYVVTLWQIEARDPSEHHTMTNVILPDGCIDLIVAYTDKAIGFTGLSKTDFNFKDDTSKRYFGFRMMPGAFHTLTGLDATQAMDAFSDAFKYFDLKPEFWEQPFERCIVEITVQLETLFSQRKPSKFMNTFLELLMDTPHNSQALASQLGYSLKHTNRLFKTHYGLSIKQILSVIRLQKALNALAHNPTLSLIELSHDLDYYDQAHFTNDISHNLGITPTQVLELFNT